MRPSVQPHASGSLIGWVPDGGSFSVIMFCVFFVRAGRHVAVMDIVCTACKMKGRLMYKTGGARPDMGQMIGRRFQFMYVNHV